MVLEAIATEMEERLQVVCGQVNAAHVRLVTLAGEVVETDAWAVAGVRTPCQWLSWQTGVSAGMAKRILRVAAASETHPLTFAVFAAGRLSLEQAAVAVSAPAHCDAQFAELAPLSTVAQLKIEVRAATPAPEPTEPDAPVESVTTWFDGDGRFGLHADLDPDRGRIVDAALRESKDRLFRDGHTDATWADALVDMAERSMGAAPLTRRERFRINLFLDPSQDIAASWGDGFNVSDAIRRFLTCDGLLVPTFVAAGRPVSVAAPTPIIPDRTRRTVLSRDRRTCRTPYCSASLGLEIHHVVHREDGGPTATPNLVALCRHCHRQHHLGHLGITGDADQPDGLTFTDQWGRIIDQAARPRPPTGPPPEPAQPYQHPTGERLDKWSLIFPNAPSRAVA